MWGSGFLEPWDGHARVALSQAMAAAARDDTDIGPHSVAIPDGAGGGCVATLLPIEGGQRQGILAPFVASVAVFVQDAVQATPMPGEAFVRLHGLTGAEQRRHEL